MATQSLQAHLLTCSDSRFTGRLFITGTPQQSWEFYFLLGRLLGVTGGIHPKRKLYRQLRRHCSTVLSQEGAEQQFLTCETQIFEILKSYINQQKIRRDQALAMLEGILAESLFDLLQLESLAELGKSESLTYELLAEKEHELSELLLTLIRVETCLAPARKAWEAWQSAGFASITPTQAPVILNHERLQCQVTEPVYRKLVLLIDGHQTLRDLSLRLNRDLVLFTRSFVHHLNGGSMGLREIPDLSLVSPTPKPELTPKQPAIPGLVKHSPTHPLIPLVAHIDDSLVEAQLMQQIVTQFGCQFIHIADPLQALLTVLERKPHLIFLDLVMPIVNGYEVCAQLRRSAALKDTPIVILTGNDGPIDRIRAKLVAASDFVAKPIDSEKVLTVLKKYNLLPTVPSPAQPRS